MKFSGPSTIVSQPSAESCSASRASASRMRRWRSWTGASKSAEAIACDSQPYPSVGASFARRPEPRMSMRRVRSRSYATPGLACTTTAPHACAPTTPRASSPSSPRW